MSRLKSAHDLSGLMKYADRAPWDEAMDEMLSAHLGPACEATGLEPDAIFEIIGDHWQTTKMYNAKLTIWFDDVSDVSDVEMPLLVYSLINLTVFGGYFLQATLSASSLFHRQLNLH